eukprot:8946070-Alexandrium_andersonii.AAC.1
MTTRVHPPNHRCPAARPPAARVMDQVEIQVRTQFRSAVRMVQCPMMRWLTCSLCATGIWQRHESGHAISGISSSWRNVK